MGGLRHPSRVLREWGRVFGWGWICSRWLKVEQWQIEINSNPGVVAHLIPARWEADAGGFQVGFQPG